MAVSRNMLTCRHDGVETLNIFSQWLELDICRWLRFGGCSEIGTRDHNLGGIERVEKAKRIGHVVSIRFLTVRQFSLHHNVVCPRMVTCVCVPTLSDHAALAARPGQGQGKLPVHQTTHVYRVVPPDKVPQHT